MILGLPGESYESWRVGIEETLQAGLKNQLFVYQCEVYPNTDMGDPAYQKKFGIVTKRIELREIHGSVRTEAWVPEYQDIIIETATMTNHDWHRMVRFATVTMLLHSMKFGFYVLGYLAERLSVRHTEFIEFITERRMSAGIGSMMLSELDFYDAYLDRLMAGGGRGVEMAGYGDIYWDVEESSFLRISENLDRFYEEFHGLLIDFLMQQGTKFDREELAEVILYQRLRMPSVRHTGLLEYRFKFSVPEYFARRFSSDPVSLIQDAQILRLEPKDFGGDSARFARESILWGRKSGTMLVGCDWWSLDRPEITARTTAVFLDGLIHQAALPRAANLGEAELAS